MSRLPGRGIRCSHVTVYVTNNLGITGNKIFIPLLAINSSFPKNVFNTFYLTDSYIVFTLKMESVSKNAIFGLKMMVKSGIEKYF